MPVKETSRLHFLAIQNCDYGQDDFRSRSELNGLILANNIKLSPQGYLSKDSIATAVKLSIPFASMQTIDDEEEHLQRLRQANALFAYAQRTLCTCAQCAL